MTIIIYSMLNSDSKGILIMLHRLPNDLSTQYTKEILHFLILHENLIMQQRFYIYQDLNESTD